jgi:hypothetical protein
MVSVIISIMVDHSFDHQVDQTKACETDIFCIFYFFTEQAAFRIKSKNCYLIQDNVSELCYMSTFELLFQWVNSM